MALLVMLIFIGSSAMPPNNPVYFNYYWVQPCARNFIEIFALCPYLHILNYLDHLVSSKNWAKNMVEKRDFTRAKKKNQLIAPEQE